MFITFFNNPCMLYNTNIDPNSIRRYSRQIILDQIGLKGQKQLEKSKVLIVGLGGLGSPVLTYLASAGIGTIGIVDFDILELHNLQRQTIHNENYIGRLKTESAHKFIQEFNSSIKVIKYEFSASEKTLDIIKGYDLVLDCSDNINVRYSISDMCKLYEKPMILASVLRFEGQILCLPAKGPCYRCLFPEKKENIQNCDAAGVMGSVCGIIGSIQATEAIKFLIGREKTCMMLFDAWAFDSKVFDLTHKLKENCPACLKKEIKRTISMGNTTSNYESLDKKYALTWETFIKNKDAYKLIDLRPENMFNMCNIKDSINIPADVIEKNPKYDFKTSKKIALLCRKGLTAKKTASLLVKNKQEAYYLIGGLERFKAEIDTSFPLN